jgi:hypothetical protein
MSQARTITVDAPAASASRDGGAVRRDEVDHRAARRHDLPALRIGPSSSPIAAAAASLRSPHAPALVPATAPLVPRAVAVARPAAIENGVELDEPADERGERVAHGAVAIPRPPPPGGAGPRLQRTSLPELFVAMVTPDREEAGGLLVEDGAQTLTSGQMRKAEFMRQLRTEVCRVAEQELARAGRSAAGCPYIDQMLAYYDGKSAEHLERALRRYAPETRRLRDAREYLPVLSARLGAAIARWATTGQMPTDVPNETLAALAGARNGIVGAIAGIAGISRKATPGAAPATVDAGALIRQLGPGHALDGGTQARMERALGHSFAGVRIHADDRAAALSHDLAARAFTLGRHVAFAAGELRPGTPHGDALLAHELAHVVQQGTAAPAGEVPLGAAADPLEHDADLAAAAAVEQLHGDEEPPRRPPRWRAAGGGLRLQRCGPSATGPRVPDDMQGYNRLVASLRTTFGVEVRDETAQWRPFQLERMHEALSLLSPAERAIIRGSTLVRVDHTGVMVAGVEAQAYFELGMRPMPNDQPPQRVRNLRVGNHAIDLQASDLVALIVHELGHAIEVHARQQAQFASESAGAEANRQIAVVVAADSALVAAHNAATQLPTAYSNPDYTASVSFRRAAEDVTTAIQTLSRINAGTIAQRAQLEGDLTQKLAARDSARSQLNLSAPQNPALTDYAALLTTQDAAAAAARERARLIVARIDRGREEDAVTANLGTERISARLNAFITVVRQHSIGPLTPYARMVHDANGDTAPYFQEQFAEAFRLWRTERSTLEYSAPDLVRWFDAGGHLR